MLYRKIIYLGITLLFSAAASVAIVSKVTQRRGTTKLANAYLNFLFSKEAQALIAKHNFRPRDTKILNANSARFPAIKTFTVDEKLGGWEAVNKKHFADGTLFDQIMVNR